MARVLIVSPHFPPTHAADCQRIRLYAPYFAAHGWDAEILAVAPEDADAPQDPMQAELLGVNLPVHRVRAPLRAWQRWLGARTLARRALSPLRRAGDALLATRRFDLVYFCTTQFLLHALGPQWRRKHAVPFVWDVQDPWYSTFYRDTGLPPPGGRLRYALAQAQARRHEPRVYRDCAGLTTVSAPYYDDLAQRYAEPRPHRVLPFGVDLRDLDAARSPRVINPVFDAGDGLRHWVYVGRGGADTAYAADALFRALARRRAQEPEWRKVRLHAIGTSYAGARAQASYRELAAAHGLSDAFEERTDRLPLHQALRVLIDADALFVPGSTDPQYAASKLYPYFATGKPMLLLAHADSAVLAWAARFPQVAALGLRPDHAVETLTREIDARWFEQRACARSGQNAAALTEFSAPALCAQLCAFFDSLMRG
jgi:glycosyltransferase involved in cell wall biosynthesis